MRISIIGKTLVSEQLKKTLSAAGMDIRPAEDVAACDLCVISILDDIEALQKTVAEVSEETDAVIAVVVVLDYVAAAARYARDPSKVVGLRTMNGEHIEQYIEITRGFETSEETYQTVLTVLKKCSACVAEVPDVIGGIYYRLLPLLPNIAAKLVSEGVSPRDVDYSMRYGANMKKPPLQLADEIGIDVLLHVLERLYQETGDAMYRPCPLLRKMVAAGRLGKKSGQGFFKYD